MYSQSGYPYSPYGYGGATGYPGSSPGTGYPQGATPTPGFAQPQPSPAPGSQAPGQLPIEQSFIENILRLNRGKIGTFYMTYEYNDRWNAKVFKGVVEAAGRDHIIISDPQTGKRYLLLMVNLDYVTFDEELKYDYDWPGAAQPDLETYPPR
ncbi:spore coat protein GerQ [Evansella sp. AB-P1]|uniref:spore coat protein GerQ n=1 Tax=Evansella sp. AB-P1 TaxID=3037653 RepID=UPI00241DAA1D|nr:spore coat protein GerQ [Evansella sp. AB-P1]MDG5787396.1 spore coat protein GerQ [Evansella sp. AB-P1]